MRTIYRYIAVALLLMLFASGLHAFAETLTATFDQGLPEGWMTYGSVQNNSDRARSGKGLWTSAKADKTNYIITGPIEGDIEFYARSYNTRGYGYVTLYTVNEDNTLGDKIIEFKTDNVSSGPISFKKYTYTLAEPRRVGIDLYWSCIDDFTYTPQEGINGPALTVVGYESGSRCDFGGEPLPAESREEFVLKNLGSEVLAITSITVSGGYRIVEGADLASLSSGQSASLVLATPAYDATGVLNIVSDDTNSPYIINLSSRFKPAAPLIEVNVETIDFGVVEETKSKTFSITNKGDADLEASVTTDNPSFSVQLESLSIAPGESADVAVKYHFSATDYGVHTGIITVTHNAGDAITIPVSATVRNPNVWMEHFDDNTLPAGWEAGSQWSFANGVAKATYNYSDKNSQLITPSLSAQAGETLTFRYKATQNYVDIKIKGSINGSEFVDLDKISTNQMSDFKTYTIKVSETGDWRFCFINDDYELDDFEGLILNNNAPRMEVSPMAAADFGKVIDSPMPLTYSISNVGTGKMNVIISSDNDDFQVSPTSIDDIEPDSPVTFTISFNYNISDLGQKYANITVIPSYSNKDAVTIVASAKAMDPNVWVEDFEDGILPATWDNQGSWKVDKPSYSGSNGSYMANVRSVKPVSLTTPRLHADLNDILKFYIGMQYDDEPLTIEYSTDDKMTWRPIDPTITNYTESADISFVAPEEAFYYLRFTGTYAMIDNFNGFKLATREHELSLKSIDIPANIYQYADCFVSVTVAEMSGKSTTAGAELFINGECVAKSDDQQIMPFDTATFTFDFEIAEILRDATAFVVISYDEYQLKTPEVTVEIIEAPVFDETAVSLIPEGNKPAAVVRYSPVEGWNTIAMPFALNEEILEQIFGLDFKAYEFYESADGEVRFKECSKFVAGYPYLVYSGSGGLARQGDIIVKDVNVESAIGKYDEYNGVRFQAYFTPDIHSGQESCYIVHPTELKLQQCGSDDHKNGYRASFIVNEPIASVPQIAVFDNNGQMITGIGNVQDDGAQRGKIYDLYGRSRGSVTGGEIYIIDGKKVISR